MPPFLIALAVGAVYAFIKWGEKPSTLPAALFAAGRGTGITTGFNPPATTATNAGQDTTTNVTNQPGTSGSGVPSSAPQARPFSNPNPGYPMDPSIPATLPFYGYPASLFMPRQIREMSRTNADGGSGGGCGCGCGGVKKSSCGGGGCGHQDGAGDCSSSSAMPNNPPKTKTGYIANLASAGATPFLTFQTLVNDFQVGNGEVPAGPSYHY